jgi:hypothetical protein
VGESETSSKGIIGMGGGVGLISAGGKQPQFQFISSLGKFEIKDKKL